MDVDAARDLMRLTTVQARRRSSRHAVSARACRASLAAIERHSGLNAFETLCAERALDRADAVRPGDGALCGVPVGIRTCSRRPRGRRPRRKPRVSAMGTTGRPRPRPRAPTAGGEGAIVIGKTNGPELRLRPVTENLRFGATRNPGTQICCPPAGRRGSAAAVSAGLVGSPTATSAGRTTTRVPLRRGRSAESQPRPGLDQPLALRRSGGRPPSAGVLTSTVLDAAVALLGAIAGAEPDDRLDAQRITPPAGRMRRRPKPGRAQVRVALNVCSACP
jgi:amidase